MPTTYIKLVHFGHCHSARVVWNKFPARNFSRARRGGEEIADRDFYSAGIFLVRPESRNGNRFS
jgi:hypothetical protein